MLTVGPTSLLEHAKTSLLRAAWSCRSVRRAGARPITIVLYHGVPATTSATMSSAVFERHVLFLKQHFQLVSPNALDQDRPTRSQHGVLLTFDDGFRNHAEVVAPLLRRHRVPALFFVSSRHAVKGRYLWFAYLKALEQYFGWAGFSFRGEYFCMGAKRQESIRRLTSILLSLRPHPSAMYEAIERELPPLERFVSPRDLAEQYEGMTSEQVGELAADPLFGIGVHTTDHPFLTQAEPTEARRQIEENRAWIEKATGRGCNTIAYPAGDYNAALLKVCEEVGFTDGYAVSSRLNSHSRLERSRIGVYSESTDVLGFKVQWATALRKLRIPIG